MAINYSYPGIEALDSDDLLLVTDTSQDNSTKSVNIQTLANYIDSDIRLMTFATEKANVSQINPDYLFQGFLKSGDSVTSTTNFVYTAIEDFTFLGLFPVVKGDRILRETSSWSILPKRLIFDDIPTLGSINAIQSNAVFYLKTTLETADTTLQNNIDAETTARETQIKTELYNEVETAISLPLTTSSGIAYSSGNSAGSGYYVPAELTVSEGDIINYNLAAALNFCMIAAYNNGTYLQASSLAGVGGVGSVGVFSEGTYTVPSGVTTLKLATNSLTGAYINYISYTQKYASSNEVTELKAINYFNTNFNEPDFDNVDGKFYGQRALIHSNYVTDTSKTVYVSQANGLDTNSGLTSSLAVKTLTKADTLLNHGDTLLIERGSKFTDIESITKNGLIIDCYGNPKLAKPTSYNLIDITDASLVEKVVGATNVYRVAWVNNGASASDRAAIQVIVDDEACGDWTIYTGYTPTANDVFTLSGALNYMDANVDNAAWCDAYISSGFANGWSAGTNYIYFSLSWDATNQTTLDAHKLQITRQVGQLINFTGVDNDLRNFIWETICFNICTPCQFNENVELRNFVRHGFHYKNSWFKNCETNALSGIGKHYHYQPTSDTTFYDEIILSGCKAISHRNDYLGVLFDGHGTNTSVPVIMYNRAIVKDCYAENLELIVDAPNMVNVYVINTQVKNVSKIGVFREGTIVDGVFGTLYENGEKKGIITPPVNGKIGKLRNVHLSATSQLGGMFLMYSVTPVTMGTMELENVHIFIKKLADSQATAELSQTFAFWAGYTNFKMTDCTFSVKHVSGASENFKRSSDSADFSNMDLTNCVFAGITNNSGALVSQTFLEDVSELSNFQYLPRLQYVANGVMKTIIPNF